MGKAEAAVWAWGIAALAGILAGVLLWLLGGWTAWQSIFAALFVAVVLGILFAWLFLRPLPAPAVPGSAGRPAAPAAPAATDPEARPAPAVPAARTASAPPPAAPAVAAAPAQSPAPAASAPPPRLDAARAGGADDLKRIKGVGPKLEDMLHRMGVFHFDQIAAWGPAELAWVDDNLEGFRGRASRDRWVEQARQLAAGGETEFSRRVDEGDVYGGQR
ncbi:MAG: NADH:ubiquinone oxidoreductase [Rhodobacteraceae bacterium]|nr:NADH:ubiquinone oxidoreductase [Paracoccaceae bacterium]